MAPGAPERFRLRADALRSAVSQTRRRWVVTLAAFAAIVAALWAAVLRPQGSGAGSLAFLLALLGMLAATTLVRRMRRLHARWESFCIAIDEDGVSRHVDGFPPVRIARADAATLEEGARGIVVRDRGGRSILVPREVEGYERLRALLVAWGSRGG